jgi:hypothetical protein
MNDISIVQLDDFKKKHIAILCLPGLEGFLGDIIAELQKKYRVTTCYSKSLAELEAAAKDADLVFLEWANELAIELTRNSKVLETKKVVVRLHSYEALSGYVQHIRWALIDTIIFVAKHIQDIVVKQLPGLQNKDLHPPKMVVIPNGVAI